MVYKNMPQSPSVLVIHNVLWSHYKATVFRELSTLMVPTGIRLSVVHISETEGKRSAVDDRTRALHTYPHVVLFQGSRENHNAARVAIRIARVVWRMNPSVVVVPGYADLASWAAFLVAKLRGGRVIVAVDSTLLDKRRFALLESIKKLFVSNCDAAFVYGVRAGEYCARLGMHPDRIIVRCQATDNAFVAEEAARYRIDPDGARAQVGVSWKHTILLLGRLAPEKNFGIVIRALGRVLRTYPEMATEWGMLIVGHGPEQESLSALARNAGVPVHFSGGVPWWEVPRFLSLSEIMVLPSLSEPWGLVVNEAMSADVVAVVSAICGCAPDLITDGETGFVFDPRDDEKLALILEQLMRDPELRRRVKEAARMRIATYSPQGAAEQMARGIKEVLENGGRGDI